MRSINGAYRLSGRRQDIVHRRESGSGNASGTRTCGDSKSTVPVYMAERELYEVYEDNSHVA